jgi:outer membrane protein
LPFISNPNIAYLISVIAGNYKKSAFFVPLFFNHFNQTTLRMSQFFLKITCLIFFVANFNPENSFSQTKYGHVNIGNLLEMLPEVKNADSLLIVYRDSIIAVSGARTKQFEEKVNAFVKKRDAGELTRIQEQTEGENLKKEEEYIANLENIVMDGMQRRRKAYLEPILGRVNDAIQAVGKEGGYAMIFDTSVPNTVLFVSETDDVLPAVLAKLGVKK